MELRPYQVEAEERVRQQLREGHRSVMLQAGTGLGKCLGRDTMVLMHDGSQVPVQEVERGDLLMGDDSLPRKVLSLASGIGPLYRITPAKGDSWVCNDAHILSLVHTTTGEVWDINVEDYLKMPKNRVHWKQYSVPVDFAEQEVWLDPYFFGLWLGDGSSRNTIIWNVDEEVIRYVYEYGDKIGARLVVKHSRTCLGYALIGAGIHTFLREQNLLLNKHIPLSYLANSREKRLQLLAGLMDTDGYLAEGCFEIVIKSDALARDVAQLARSLGLKVTTARKFAMERWYNRLIISGHTDMIPTKVARRQAGPRLQIKNALRTGIKVEPIGEGEYFGFEIDGNHRFLLGDMTVTHNTVMASSIIEKARAKGGHTLFVAHRRELIKQASEKLSRFSVPHSVVMLGYPAPSIFDRVHVGTIQSFTARIRRGIFKPEDVRVVIIDESHRAAGATYGKLLDLYPKAVLIGLSATPMRTDGRGLGDLFTSLVSTMSYEEAVRQGHLVPLRYFVPSVPDLKGIRTTAGDYNEGDLEKRMNTPKLTGDIVDHWKRIANGRLTICFGITVQHSLALRDAFLRSGVSACHIDGNTPNDERDELFSAFVAGQYRVLCNVGIATEGTDVPEVSCIVQAFATKSAIKHIQTCGRGSRPFPGTEDCIILDHGGNTQRLGRVEDFTDWTLEESKGANDAKEKEGEKKEVKEAAQLLCASCHATFSGTIICPVCGFLYDVRKAPKEVLVEPGLLEEMRGKGGVSMERKREEFAMLVHHGSRQGYKPGWASNQYKEKHGVWPDKVHGVAPVPPDFQMAGWIKSQQIRRAKSRFVPSGRQ